MSTLSSLSPHEQIIGMAVTFWQSRALTAAVELELADLLSEGPLTLDELALRANANSAILSRLLRALETIRIFTQPSPGVFANTPVSECLRKDAPDSQRSTVLLQLSDAPGQYRAWGNFTNTVKTGRPAYAETYNKSLWQVLNENPKANDVFNDSMNRFSIAMTPAVTAAHDWTNYTTIADIGGGIGTQILDILNQNESCRGVLFDQPSVLAAAAHHPRLQCVSGDFFQQVPSGLDAYMLRWITHDWNDVDAVAILQTVRKAVRPDSTLILVDTLVTDSPESSFAKWADLLMVSTLGGKERTEEEFGEILSASGFSLQEIVPTASPFSILFASPVISA
jgi:hypothetical protein